MAPRRDWNLRMVGAEAARRLLPTHPDGTLDWGTVRVGHLDTGYTRHPIFGDWAHDASWLAVNDGWNTIDDTEDATDPLDYEGNPGHGTRTLSVICGDARLLDPNDATTIGIAPGLPVVPFRCVNSVVLSRERHRRAVARAIDRAVAAGCEVISISLGMPFFPPGKSGGMGEAVDRAYAQGVIIVAAGGQVIDSVTYPGKYNRTIGCGGVTWQRRIWQNYRAGKELIDVWAPAEGVRVADRFVAPGADAMPPVEGDDPGSFARDTEDDETAGREIGSSSSGSSSDSSAGKLAKSSGTSYATAQVAAAAAMWLRRRGDELAGRYDQPWQRVEAFRTLLQHRTAGRVQGPLLPNGSRLLTIHRLLEAPLPAAASLHPAAADAGKSL